VYRSSRLPVLILALVAGSARADDGDATALFTRGRELFKAGDYKQACPLFEESFRLEPALGTKLNLALCWAKIGRLVEARKMFEAVQKDATEAGQTQRADLAQSGLDALAAQMPTLKIKLAGMPDDTRVQVDGDAVEITNPLPLDPGEHHVTATGAREVVYTAREGATAEITLEALPAPTRPTQVLIVGGAAAGALAIGTITGIVAIRANNASNAHCQASADGDVCDQRGLDLRSHARTLSHVTTGLFAAGIAVGVYAVVLELRWRDVKVPPLVIEPTTAGASVTWTGRW